jgi:hypothetical protein
MTTVVAARPSALLISASLLSVSLLAAPIPAHAGDGPAPVYAPPPPPVYIAPAPTCYYAPGAPMWDQWRGVWVRPQVQVCN